MFQGKANTVTFEPEQTPMQRLKALEQTLIDQGVVRQHTIYLTAPGYDNLDIGAWPVLYCSNEDLLNAKGALIKW